MRKIIWVEDRYNNGYPNGNFINELWGRGMMSWQSLIGWVISFGHLTAAVVLIQILF